MAIEEWFSRPDKLNHADTILYEINMLRLAINRMSSFHFLSEPDKWIYLEAFLLHYRNLLEFFSGRITRFAHTDLSIKEPQHIWGEKQPDNETLDQLTKPELYEKYERQEEPVSISKYLQHCTIHRINAKSWNIGEMYEELRPVLEMFESSLPARGPMIGFGTPSDFQWSEVTTCSTFSTALDIHPGECWKDMPTLEQRRSGWPWRESQRRA
jgi:hypothetical protein